MKIFNNIYIKPNTVISIPFRSKEEQTVVTSTGLKNTSINNYLKNEAVINSIMVQKVKKNNETPLNYQNNLRTMIQNNESVMLAIAPRTFTAEDTNKDEKISLALGEKPGTLLSAISRLDELKDLGINTLHILPIHPPGLKNAMGTAGSIYSPARFIEEDGSLAIDPVIIEKDDPRSPSEQFKTFIDECHKRDIKVMLDIPSCASVSWFEAEPELMAFGRNGEEKTPQGWEDIRMFQPWDDETERTLNPKLLELHKQYVDACIDLGIDGIRADVARAKPTEFWDILIPYSREKDPEFAWLAESYTYECASPQVNMPYDRPEDMLRAGFDDFYGQYHIFHEWNGNKDFNDYIKLNLELSHRLPAGKSCIGSFATHDDTSPMTHGGENYCNMTTIIQSTIPMCNPYFVDGFQSGDYYNYRYSHIDNTETVTYKIIHVDNFDENKIKGEFQTDGYYSYQYSAKDYDKDYKMRAPYFKMDHHKNKLDIFNLSRKPEGNNPDIARVMSESLKMRTENKDLFSNRNSSFITLEKKADKKDQIIAYARHNNGRTAIVIANKNPNRNMSGTIKIPGLSENQILKNIAPCYGEKSKFQVAQGELRVDLSPASAYVFEIDTPNIEKDCKGNVFKQKV